MRLLDQLLVLLKKLFGTSTKYTVIRVWEIEAMSMNEAISIAHFRKHNRITVLKGKKVMLGGYPPKGHWECTKCGQNHRISGGYEREKE